jgi:hypothetical protein
MCTFAEWLEEPGPRRIGSFCVLSVCSWAIALLPCHKPNQPFLLTIFRKCRLKT